MSAVRDGTSSDELRNKITRQPLFMVEETSHCISPRDNHERFAPWTGRFNRTEIDCWSCWIRRIWIAFDPTSNRQLSTIVNRYTKRTRLFPPSIFRLMVLHHL